MNKLLGLFILMLIASSCEKETHQFEMLPASQSGISFENTLTENDQLNILDYLYFYNGGGVAMGDINNDGLPDLYFSANQKGNQLYLNKGNLKFEDITQNANVQGESSWNTGAIMGDINGDGWLDIYVIAVVGINGFEGHNELFINNQDNTFTERSAEYGLDFQSYGTTAALLDFDLDGDLDIYLLNHAVHTEESFGRAQIRKDRNDKTGDRLLRNDGDTFTDISEAAGIFGGINGYGLGVSISDFNQDGYPDIYVGNDFHEDDYYYLNNGDGTFTESLKKYFGHTSRFSMGNDVADINQDGLPDIISLDMAPEDETVLKSSEGDDTYQILKMRTEQFGYHYQYTRNMLFLNNGSRPYTETALLSGVSATDWSWSALFGDYDQDGQQDLFISNGIPRRPNDLDFIRFVSNEEIQKKMVESKLVDQQALEMMPNGAMHNYVFKGDGKAGFTNKSGNWIPSDKTVSGATAVGDLDGDGDLDIVTNNINATVGIYVNQTNGSANYLKIKFQFKEKNLYGIGTKVYAYHNGALQFKELFPTRGWQASSEPMLHFGFGNITEIDSVKIIWPDKTYQILQKVTTNQSLVISPEKTQPYSYEKYPKRTLFRKTEDNLGINYTHKEDNHTDFNYQKLIPYEVSDRGPAAAVGDMNGDGKKDIFLGGAKNQKASIFLQTETGFELGSFPSIENDSIYEDVSASIVKSAATNKSLLSVLSGGNTVSPSKKYLINRWYQENNGTMEQRNFGDTYYNSSVIKGADANSIEYSTIIGNHTVPLDFGKPPPLSFLKNNGDRENYPDFGMVTDAVWDDFDNDGQTDLIVVGEWMAPKFFKNNSGELTEVSPLKNNVSGLWQTIIPFDIDKDGDTDYLLGNWGLNTKFKASQSAPMKMYYADFDDNGSTETILAIEKGGRYYPLLGLNELAEQLVFLRKKFGNYKDFAGKTIEEILGKELLNKATIFEVNTLTSGFLRNTENTFIFEPFVMELQTAPIKAFVKYDFDGDGNESVLAGGNYFGVIPFHGRFDSFSGAMIDSETKITLGNQLGLEMEHKSVRHLKIIQLNNQPYLLIVYNNETAQVYEIQE
ncbi:MAG: VCBS repeat-containing protein [Flavobacteriaceae bacterium]|nr:VCBS repeat-containing protein [Flavobacteriaceae bacterium]